MTKSAISTKGIDTLRRLYSLTDAERFPASQMADGLERENTLYYADFSVAIPFGMEAVIDTFERTHYKHMGYKYVTELALVMNHLGWQIYGAIPSAPEESKEALTALSTWFFARYQEVASWAHQNLTDDELSFFVRILD